MTSSIDFQGINRAALGNARSLLQQILPGGKFRSFEYIARNPRRDDQKPGSFSINYKTGVWKDFSSRDGGSDLVSLVAYLKGGSQGEAARELGCLVGISVPPYNGNGTPKPGGQYAAPTKTPSLSPPIDVTQPPFVVSADLPTRGNEIRRHLYQSNGATVRIKIKFADGRYQNWYLTPDAQGTIGWQPKKPTDYIAVPYITTTIDPFDPELRGDEIFWPEGEKDCDTLGLRKAQGIEQTAPAVTTMNMICDLYETWPMFAKLADSTQRQYRYALAVVRKAWGDLPAAGVRPVHVQALMDQLAATPGKANNVLGLLWALSKWGVKRDHFPHSITEGITPYRTEGGHKPWTAAQLVAAEKNLTGMLRRAYFLARYTGQRGSDVVKLGETFIDEGGFRILQQKNGRKIGDIWCPIEEPLAAEMATWERLPGPYLRQNHGKRYGKELLHKHFLEAREAIPELAEATIDRYCRFADKKANGKAAVIAHSRNGARTPDCKTCKTAAEKPKRFKREK